MKKSLFFYADLILLATLLFILALFFGGKTTSVAPSDIIFLSSDGKVFVNDELIDQFSEPEIEYTLSAEIAKRLHDKFQARAVSQMVWLRVDGETMVGWNNRLVDVVYGIVEKELATWAIFIYQLNQEDGTQVEVGLHDRATQIALEIRVSAIGSLLAGKQRILGKIVTDEIQEGETGLYLVTLGGGHLTVSEVREKARSMFGEQTQIGFEQRLEALPTDQSTGFYEWKEGRCVQLELREDGTVLAEGEVIAKYPRDFELAYEPSSQVRAFWEWEKARGGIGQVLLLVDGGAKNIWYQSLRRAPHVEHIMGSIMVHSSFAKIDGGPVHPLDRMHIFGSHLKLDYEDGLNPQFERRNYRFDWVEKSEDWPRLVFSSPGPKSGTVRDARRQIKTIFGKYAELSSSEFTSLSQDLAVSSITHPVAFPKAGSDNIHLSGDGTINLNGKYLAKFDVEQSWYKDTQGIGQRLHRLLKERALHSEVQLSISSTARVGWNNRLVDVIYGLVEHKLTPWTGFSYQVDEEQAISVEIGLYKTARQITAEFLPEDELEPEEYQPFLYLAPEHAELPLGGNSPDEGLCMVAIGGGEKRLLQARKELRRLFGPDAQVGFEQRVQVIPAGLSNETIGLPGSQWDELKLLSAGSIYFNHSELPAIPLDFTNYLDLSKFGIAVEEAIKKQPPGRGLRIQVESATPVHCLNVVTDVVSRIWMTSPQQLAAVCLQVDDNPIATITPGLFFRSRHISCDLGATGDLRIKVGDPSIKFHVGGRRKDEGMCTHVRVGRDSTVGEMRDYAQQVFGPYAEYGFSQELRAVVKPVEKLSY